MKTAMNKSFDHDKLHHPIHPCSFSTSSSPREYQLLPVAHESTTPRTKPYSSSLNAALFPELHISLSRNQLLHACQKVRMIDRISRRAEQRQTTKGCAGWVRKTRIQRRGCGGCTSTQREGEWSPGAPSIFIFFHPYIFLLFFFFLFRMNFLSNPRRTRILFPFFAHFARFFNSSDISWLVRMLIFGNQWRGRPAGNRRR